MKLIKKTKCCEITLDAAYLTTNPTRFVISKIHHSSDRKKYFFLIFQTSISKKKMARFLQVQYLHSMIPMPSISRPYWHTNFIHASFFDLSMTLAV